MQDKIVDVAIIGSGPAGLTAGIYTTRGALSTVIVGGSSWGGQLMLTSEVDNFPGFPEGIMGPDLMENMKKQALRFGAEFIQDNVTAVDFSSTPFKLTTSNQQLIARTVIIATGAAKMAESRQIKIATMFDDDIPPLQLDPILFREAMQNLVDNGIDYNLPGGTLQVSLKKGSKHITLTVTNTGHGIEKEELLKIFNQFYRSPAAVKQQPNGNGLGLFLTRTIVNQHGGDITCTSQLNKETTFTVTLPLEPSHE